MNRAPQGPLPSIAIIQQRVEERRSQDPFGFEIEDYILRLPYEQAKPDLAEGINEKDWKEVFVPLSREELLGRMEKYIPFAFMKANDYKGLSANRSVMHYIAWTWLAGDTSFSQEILDEYENNYQFYGKLILRKVCEYYGWDWKTQDNGILRNDEPI